MSKKSDNYFDERDDYNRVRLEKIQVEDLPDFCDQFFLGIEPKTTFLTRLNYAYDLKVFFDYLIKKHPLFKEKTVKKITLSDLEELTLTDMEKYMSYLGSYKSTLEDGAEIRRNNRERGKARKITTVRVLYKYFFKKNLLSSDIASKIESPKIHEKEIVRLEVNEVANILNLAESGDGFSGRQKAFQEKTRARDLAMLTLFLGTGIRISECVGLNVDDIDLSSNAFNITRKGGKRVTLYFSDEVVAALNNYLREREGFEELKDEKALFLSLQNKRITTRAVQNLVKKYSRLITPLKKITPHKLRSTYGTALYRETRDIYIVADVLGHKDVNTTKKHYAAISEDLRRAAATKVTLREPDNRSGEDDEI